MTNIIRFDAWAPDWNEAPDWAQWHTVDDEGGWWWESCPCVGQWTDMDAEGNQFERESWTFGHCEWECEKNYRWLEDIDGENTKGFDWRNSLRHRPETDNA